MSLLKSISGLFSNDLYVQIWEHTLKVSDVDSKHCFDEEPLMALKKNEKGVAVVEVIGDSVKSLINQSEYAVVNPFSHPRTLLHDFPVAEKVLKHVFREIHKDKLFTSSPRVIIHPIESWKVV